MGRSSVLAWVCIGLWASLASAQGPHAGTTAERQTAEQAPALAAAIESALSAGDDARAMALVCDYLGQGGSPHPWADEQTFAAFTERVRQLMRRRYAEVFQGPGNAAVMLDGTDLAPVRRPAPRREGSDPCFLLRRHGVSMVQHEEVTSFRPDDPGHARLTANYSFLEIDPGAAALVVIDLDLDGEPEVTFDGHEALVGAHLNALVDRAPDDRRVQWLVSRRPLDPRRQAEVWLYRDGTFYFVLVDTDGDGRGDCGRSQIAPALERSP